MMHGQNHIKSDHNFHLGHPTVLYILQGTLPITNNTIIYVLSGELRGYMFRPLGV